MNAQSEQTDLTEFFVLFRYVLKRFSARTFHQGHRTSLKHTKEMLDFVCLFVCLLWFIPLKVNM